MLQHIWQTTEAKCRHHINRIRQNCFKTYAPEAKIYQKRFISDILEIII